MDGITRSLTLSLVKGQSQFRCGKQGTGKGCKLAKPTTADQNHNAKDSSSSLTVVLRGGGGYWTVTEAAI